jgi:hypothetical protein
MPLQPWPKMQFAGGGQPGQVTAHHRSHPQDWTNSRRREERSGRLRACAQASPHGRGGVSAASWRVSLNTQRQPAGVVQQPPRLDYIEINVPDEAALRGFVILRRCFRLEEPLTMRPSIQYLIADRRGGGRRAQCRRRGLLGPLVLMWSDDPDATVRGWRWRRRGGRGSL